MAPVLERIATEKESGLILAKANTSDNMRMARKLNVRSVPTVKIFDNGKVVADFVGGRTEPFIRKLLTDLSGHPRPTAALKISDIPKQRLKQGKNYLKKGKGFEATIALRDFPIGSSGTAAASELSAEAAKLLPLAQLLWDLDDGDGWTGKRKIDKLYEEILISMEERRPAETLAALQALLKIIPAAEQPRIEALIVAAEMVQ